MDSILLTKFIASLLYPMGLAAVFAVLAVWAHIVNHAKLSWLFKVGSILVLLLASNPQIARLAMTSLESQHPQLTISEIARHDLILVLGGSLRLPNPPAKSVQLGAGSDRLWHAAQLFHADKADKIMVAGGNVFQQTGLESEATYAAQLLSSWGVEKESIITEPESRNTEQNFANILDYLQSQKIESVLLVTSAYHMPRALHTLNLQLARESLKAYSSSLKITPSSADIIIRHDSRPELLNWIPSANALLINTMVVHEYYGKWFVDLKALMVSG